MSAELATDRGPDRPVVAEQARVSDRAVDPDQYDGRALTSEVARSVREADERPRWSLDTSVGRGEKAGDVLRRHHFGAGSEQRELSPDVAKKNADYLAARSPDRPWLAPAADADPLVQAIYVERDQSVGHDLQRHEGWRGDQGQHDRALHMRDPAHPYDSPEYLRSNDAFGQGRLHDCWRYSTHAPDPVAYATAYARLTEHPRVRAVLDRTFDPDDMPDDITDLSVEEIVGPDGHTAFEGYQLLGDNPKLATKERQRWVKAVRAEIDQGADVDTALARVRESTVSPPLVEPRVARIESFEGGTIEVKFEVSARADGYDVYSFYANPKKGPT